MVDTVSLKSCKWFLTWFFFMYPIFIFPSYDSSIEQLIKRILLFVTNMLWTVSQDPPAMTTEIFMSRQSAPFKSLKLLCLRSI